MFDDDGEVVVLLFDDTYNRLSNNSNKFLYDLLSRFARINLNGACPNRQNVQNKVANSSKLIEELTDGNKFGTFVLFEIYKQLQLLYSHSNIYSLYNVYV